MFADYLNSQIMTVTASYEAVANYITWCCWCFRSEYNVVPICCTGLMNV